MDSEKEKHEPNSLKEAYALARKQLAMLADESGNEIYRAKKVKDLDGVYQQVIRDLSTVYSIGYRPENLVRDGSWRAVIVQLVGHPELAVRAKRGYYGKKFGRVDSMIKMMAAHARLPKRFARLFGLLGVL